MDRIIKLDQIDEKSQESCGPKAANLSRLMQMGIPVPSGFCITTDSFNEHIRINKINVKSPDAKDAITRAKVPDSIQNEIKLALQALGSNFVAVRSSATAEDMPDSSFAGLHDTYLGIQGFDNCLEAVKKCWASTWNQRACEYRMKKAIDDSKISMAVIVQEMIAADSSGVIFTQDPVTHDNTRIVIESTIGLGDPLVSGRVSPDRTILSKTDLQIIENTISEKKTVCILDSTQGLIEKSTSTDEARTPSIGSETAKRLSKLALRIEDEFKCPMDIEFAVKGEEVFILQARSITALDKKSDTFEDRQVWTNANTGEVLPDVATPMTWSLVEPLVLKLLGRIFGSIGLNLDNHPVVGQFAGRAYFNINTLAACARKVPGMGDKGVTEMFGHREDVAAQQGITSIDEKDIPTLDFTIWKALLKIPGLIYKYFTFKPSMGQAIHDRLKKQSDTEFAVDLTKLSEDELVLRINSRMNDLINDLEAFELTGLVKTYNTVLYDKCKKWFGSDGISIASRITSGLGNNENANAGLSLWKLAETASNDENIKSVIQNLSGFDEVKKKLGESRSGTSFLKDWDRFMKEHGHHCRGELELYNPRWSETPDYILDQVKSYIQAIDENNFNFHDKFKSLADEREKTIAQARKRLKNPFNLALFNKLLKLAQDCAPVGESMRSQLVRKVAVLRFLLLELGKRMVQDGVFSSADDIFFLQLEELSEITLPNSVNNTLIERIKSRRAEYSLNLSITPPAVIKGHFDPSSYRYKEILEPRDIFKGTGVNPGIVRGPAKVILRAGDDTVHPGEILVAPYTDPGWSPYFLNAAALVVDMGGILSHGSIIAREYGIPAVVNVGPASQLIKTGEIVEVDGTKGIVKKF